MSHYNSSARIHRSECSALPHGWIREEIPRSTTNIQGVSGNFEVHYVSPQGKRIRSKTELIKTVGDQCDISAFDFMSGKMNPLLVRPKGTEINKRKSTMNGNRSVDAARALRTDTSLVPPIRQTASIFKQPVTVRKTQPNGSKVKSEKHSSNEKPKQLFWEKRLTGIKPSYPKVEYEAFDLPKAFKPMGPGITSETALASISTALHLNSGPIVGQTSNRGSEDLSAFLNPEQPLISATTVSQDDIDHQEDIVKEIRLQLARAMEALSG